MWFHHSLTLVIYLEDKYFSWIHRLLESVQKSTPQSQEVLRNISQYWQRACWDQWWSKTLWLSKFDWPWSIVSVKSFLNVACLSLHIPNKTIFIDSLIVNTSKQIWICSQLAKHTLLIALSISVVMSTIFCWKSSACFMKSWKSWKCN